MPAFRKGKRHALLDRTVQSVVVDVRHRSHDPRRSRAGFHHRSSGGSDRPRTRGSAGSPRTRDRSVRRGFGRDRDAIGGRAFDRRSAREIVETLPSAFVARDVEHAGARRTPLDRMAAGSSDSGSKRVKMRLGDGEASPIAFPGGRPQMGVVDRSRSRRPDVASNSGSVRGRRACRRFERRHDRRRDTRRWNR